jgi:putative tryptophan/tyrosine transport system substrate-binding protein
MSLRIACLAIGAVLLSTWRITPAQARPQPVYEIAMVLPRPAGDTERAFEEYFARRGIALETTVLIYSGRSADQPELVAALRRLAPDLIYTWGTPTTLAVAGPADGDPQQYVRDIPIVFTAVLDPLAAGLVVNLKRPGRNLTGVIPIAPLPAQINTIQAYRKLRALGVLYEPHESALAVREPLRALASAQGFKLLEETLALGENGAPDANAIGALVRQLKAQGADFLYLDPETFAGGDPEVQATRAALEAGLPTFSARENTVRLSGALLGLFSSQVNIGRFAAFKAMRILSQHVAPAGEPIETLQHFSLLINMRTALRLQAYPPLLLLDVAEASGGSAP